jgi:hypothetical protein
MNEHRKGPWKIVGRETMEDGSIYPRHVATEAGDYQICLLESMNMAALGHDRTPAEQKRDFLIAAAPDLLAALLLAVRQNNHDMLMTGDELRQCQAAIARALPQGAPE